LFAVVVFRHKWNGNTQTDTTVENEAAPAATARAQDISSSSNAYSLEEMVARLEEKVARYAKSKMLQELSDFFPAVKHAEALVKFTRAVSGV
jgi:hypothetical protein